MTTCCDRGYVVSCRHASGTVCVGYMLETTSADHSITTSSESTDPASVTMTYFMKYMHLEHDV